MLLLQLSGLVAEVLLLSFDDDRKLRLFSLNNFNKFFKMGNLSEIFNLLGSDFLVENILLLLLSDNVFNIGASLSLSNEVTLEPFGEEWSKVGVFSKTSRNVRRAHQLID